MTFTASNGMRVWRQGTSLRVRGVFPDPLVIPGLDSDALREFFQHEANHKPWHDAQPGEVWRFELDGGKGQHALGWVAHDKTWDLLDPHGSGIRKADDPISALIDAGFPRFSEATARKLEPVEDPS